MPTHATAKQTATVITPMTTSDSGEGLRWALEAVERAGVLDADSTAGFAAADAIEIRAVEGADTDVKLVM